MIETRTGNLIQSWDLDSFEDKLVRGLSLVSEKRQYPYPSRYLSTCRVTDSELKLIRLIGPHFLPYTDLTLESTLLGVNEALDNLPARALISVDHFFQGDYEGIYSGLLLVERIDKLPSKKLIRRSGGLTYKVISVRGIEGDKKVGFTAEKHYFTIDKEGKGWDVVHEDSGYDFRGIMNYGCWTLNAQIDRSQFWDVQAQESALNCSFSVEESQIKSFFYARSLPMSATGRKRPILHWVACHQRRLKSGIDIDIKEHLRGIRTFEMYGTTFNIRNPLIINAR